MWRRRMLIWVAVVATIVVVVVGALFAFQRKLIYLPAGGPLPSAAEVVPGGRDITLDTQDGLRLSAWYFPVADPRATVLVAQGNGGNRALRAPLARALVARGLSVLLLDYRGYGGNPGSPTEEGLALDARAALRFLTQEEGMSRDEIVYFGESLGCAVVTGLAIDQPPAGLVLRSPFTELAAVAKRQFPFLPVRWLLRDEFPVETRVPRLDVPITVVYGDADSIVPPEQSRRVAEAAGARAVVVPGAGHNDAVLLDGPEVINAIDAAVERG